VVDNIDSALTVKQDKSTTENRFAVPGNNQNTV
jgi:hypothetical protein